MPQYVTNTGSGNTLTFGPITPSEPNMLAVLFANGGLSYTPPPGWNSFSYPNVFYQQFSGVAPISFTCPVTGHPDNPFFSENWNTIIMLVPTTGTASLGNEEIPIAEEAPGSSPAAPFGVTAGQTLFIQFANASAGDEGADGADFGLPNITISDNSGNDYTFFAKVVVSANDQGQGVFTYANYVYVATMKSTNDSLIITAIIPASSDGPFSAAAFITNNLAPINPPPTVSSVSPDIAPVARLITGGNFQTPASIPLANGRLAIRLLQDGSSIPGSADGGGQPVEITGTNFITGATVDFGPNAATDVVVVSSTEITCVTPAGTGTVDVTVTTSGGTYTLDNAYSYELASQVQIFAGVTVFADLDSNGNVSSTLYLWPNSFLQPGGSVYRLDAYSTLGELAWSNQVTIPSGFGAYDLGLGVPTHT